MKLIKTIQTIKFRLTLRHELHKQPIEMVMITKDEAIREINRRHKSK